MVTYPPGILTAFANNSIYYSANGDVAASQRRYLYGDWRVIPAGPN
jgi:hypothetical protein